MELIQTKYDHIFLADVKSQGVLEECAVLKEFANGDIAFFPVNNMDTLDKQRLLSIVTHRNAKMMPLWDLMRGVTLKNGRNALDYFHQYVKVRTVSGVMLLPRAGQTGVALVQEVAANVPPVEKT